MIFLRFFFSRSIYFVEVFLAVSFYEYEMKTWSTSQINRKHVYSWTRFSNRKCSLTKLSVSLIEKFIEWIRVCVARQRDNEKDLVWAMGPQQMFPKYDFHYPVLDIINTHYTCKQYRSRLWARLSDLLDLFPKSGRVG